MDIPVKSRRGVYYDLNFSPYEFSSPYGEILKFPSQKKLDIFTREYQRRIKQAVKLAENWNKIFLTNLSVKRSDMQIICDNVYKEVVL